MKTLNQERPGALQSFKKRLDHKINFLLLELAKGMKCSALDAVIGQDFVIDAVGLDVGEACVEHFDQFRICLLYTSHHALSKL